MAEILLYDEIVNDGDGFGISPSSFNADLRAASDQHDIDLRVNSPGGSLWAGFSIHQMILDARRVGHKVTVRIDGAAFSIASAIAMAGSRVVMGSASVMMIHLPWLSGVAGNSEDIKRALKTLDTAKERLIDIYKAKTKQSRATIAGWLENETYFSAREAVDAKLADEISTAMPRLAALCNLGGYKLPDRIRAEIRKPAHKLLGELMEECENAKSAATPYELACAQTRVVELGQKLQRTPGVTTDDYAMMAKCLAELDTEEKPRAQPWDDDSWGRGW